MQVESRIRTLNHWYGELSWAVSIRIIHTLTRIINTYIIGV